MRNALVWMSAFACCACTVLPAAAQGFKYQLVVKMKSEVGQEVDMPSGGYAEITECNRAKKKVKIGSVAPRGLVMSPGGKSYSWTTLSARCVDRNLSGGQ